MAKKPTTIEMSRMDLQWQAEEDLRTMRRAGEIQNDKSRMAAVQKQLNELNKYVMGGVSKAKSTSKPTPKKK